MNKRKKQHLQAFSLLYDIELSMKNLIYEQSVRHQFQNESYSNLLMIIEQHNLFYRSPQNYSLLRNTIPIRNKICHMKPLNSKDLSLLKEAHFSLINPRYNKNYINVPFAQT